MRLTEPRIHPIHEDDWDDAAMDVLKDQKMRGNVQNIFRTFANYPQLAKRWMVFANHILFKSELSARDREIAILRIGWLCQSGYEWGQHVIIGKAAGLTDEEIASIKQGETADCWSQHEKFIIRAVDELRADAFVSDETWAGLAETYSSRQLMDLVFTCGQYQLVSMALNSFGVQLDDDIESF